MFMMVRTQRRTGAALIGVVALLAGCSLPPPAPGPSPAAVISERVVEVEAVFCRTLHDDPDMEPKVGTALSQSGELQHRTLGQLAAEWGRTGEAGARAQVLLECRRMGLIP